MNNLDLLEPSRPNCQTKMAPRHGSSSSSYHSDYNPWSTTVLLTLENFPSKTFFYTQFAFDILSLLAFIVFLIWACKIRNRSLPLKALICALASFTWYVGRSRLNFNNSLTSGSLLSSQINIVVWEALCIAEAEVTSYYLIDLMLWDFFRVVAICLTFYVFWNLIHNFLSLIRHSGKPHVAVTIIHYIFLGIIFLVSLAEWGLCVTSYVQTVTFIYGGTLQFTWSHLSGATGIIYWAFSMEILAWMIFVVTKAGNGIFVSKVSSPPPIFPILPIQSTY